MTLIVLTLTLLAIIWYSLETRWLRKLTAESLELQLRPFVTLSIKDTYDTDRTEPGQRLYLKNAGQGLAKNINIIQHDFKYSYGLELKGKGFYNAKKFDVISSLMPSEEIEIFVFKSDDDKIRPQELSQKMDPKYLRIPYEPRNKVKIVFEDLLGNKYFTDLEAAPNTSVVISDGNYRR